MTPRSLFVNLPVRDLPRAVAFFTTLGFAFNPAFASDQGACMVINDRASVMLLATSFFRTFTPRAICDTRTHVEALFTVSCERREDVEALVRLAVAHGGEAAGEPQDHGFMVDWGFYDLDGHGWGVAWMNPNPASA
ncbi:MAG: glyoxalase/bleomycin resistance/extradiol dioxygenase family protein [Polyangiales bacterium]